MKKQLLLLSSIFVAFTSMVSAQQRYLDLVFDSVTVTPVANYHTNIWVPPFHGNPRNPGPGQRPQTAQIYAPYSDTVAARPLIVLLHTGSFLPAIVNQQTTGNILDSTMVEMCTRFAKRGFVVMAVNYRLGWNPQTTSANTATGQLLNATYRAVQDAKNAIRYARGQASTLKIDTSRIILGGQGTGGYVSMAAATLNKYSEITLNKFIYGDPDPTDPKNGQPHVDTALSGDWNGYGGSVLNVSANPNLSGKFHFEFNLGGAMGDSVWLEQGDMPMVGFHCANDPFAPYAFGNVIVPNTGNVVISGAAGSKVVINRANVLGNNDTLDSRIINDAYTTRGVASSNGTKNLFTFHMGQYPIQSAPWEWWDRPIMQSLPGGFTADTNSMKTNPDMSAAKAKTYIDTIQGFLIPRIVIALNLPGVETFPSGVKEMANVSQYLTVYPNPANDVININLDTKAGLASGYKIVDITGRTLVNEKAQGNNISVQAMGINPGLYFVYLTLKDGNVATKRVIVKH